MVIFTSFLYSQQFSQDIIIEYPVPGQRFKSRPVIDLDSLGNLGVLWSTSDHNNNIVKFARSFNHGDTFDSLTVVDSIQLDPNGGFTQTPLIKYDLLNNPSVCYYNWSWTTGSYPMEIKKSFDGGNTFPQSLPILDASSNMIDIFYLDNTIGFIGYQSPGNKIKILRTQNNGVTYSYLSSIDPGGFIAAPLLSFVRCYNYDILVFWTGINTSTNEQVLFFNRSVDSCVTFCDKTQVDTNLIFSSNGAVSTYDNFIFLSYIGRESGGIPKLLFRKSIDNGYTFSPPNILYEFPSGFSQNPGVALKYNPNVGICILWGNGITTKFVYSTNLGLTFSQPVNVTYSPEAKREYRSLAVSDSGYIYVVSKIDTNYGVDDRVILNRAKLSIISQFKSINITTNNDFELSQNYPNPFNMQTNIPFTLSHSEQVNLEIYDIVGRKICTVVNSRLNAGNHRVKWDGRDDSDRVVSSGIYLYRIQAGDFNQTRKLLMLK